MQREFLNVLDSRSAVMKMLPPAELIATGLIQTLTTSLEFIRNETILIQLLKYMRKNILSLSKRLVFVHCFCGNMGLANYLYLLADFKHNKTIKDLILNTLSDLSSLVETSNFVCANQEYLMSLWQSVNTFKEEPATKMALMAILHRIIEPVDKECRLRFDLKGLIDKIR